jgi:hypothetical protein
VVLISAVIVVANLFSVHIVPLLIIVYVSCQFGNSFFSRSTYYSGGSQIVVRLSRKCGSLDVLHPYRPSRPVTGIALAVHATIILGLIDVKYVAI